ncbi:DUF1254 domain-containing protein [Sphingomonas sp. 28-62-11]|uniref:DUF1254 domain-containing protein n=1 Tax=Sphingomonas sp. 28-62-11 TaxID=1970432 RepID=UPI000BCDB6B8|nr:MAG: hypothetical protein B7Y49_03035 [Sphingomonas sp. 28-62-11]
MIRHWLAPLLFGIFCGLLAWHGTIAAMPRALMALAVRRVASAGGINRMTHAPVVTAKSRAIVRPSPDLLYSSCPYDVGVGPVLIDVLPIDAPYWSLSVFDTLTNTAFVRNNVQAAGEPLHIALIRKGQVAPKGYYPVMPAGTRGVALVRVLIDRNAPIGAIDRARRQSRCRVAN